MLDRKKENNTVCSSINSPSNLVNNVFASVEKVVNTAGGIFLPGGEDLTRSDFDDSKVFQS